MEKTLLVLLRERKVKIVGASSNEPCPMLISPMSFFFSHTCASMKLLSHHTNCIHSNLTHAYTCGMHTYVYIVELFKVNSINTLRYFSTYYDIVYLF